ncbi:MAG: tetratricopeptide repeat protein, partial [Chitinophagaceae bacterium]
MKHLLLLICGWLTVVFVQAQDPVLEKIWDAYHQATTDTAKAQVLIQLSMYYSEINVDTAFSLARQAFHLAQRKGNKELELNARGAEALTFVKIGASQQALAIALKCLQEAEVLKSQQLVIKLLNLIAFVYAEIDELDKAIQYSYKTMELLQTHQDWPSNLGVYINLGDFYFRKHQSDSARYYNNKAFDLAEKIQEKDVIALVKNNFGNIFLQMQQPDMALLYYRQSLPQALSTNYTSVLCESSLGIARIFEKDRQLDSSLYYANQSLAAASRAH